MFLIDIFSHALLLVDLRTHRTAGFWRVQIAELGVHLKDESTGHVGHVELVVPEGRVEALREDGAMVDVRSDSEKQCFFAPGENV